MTGNYDCAELAGFLRGLGVFGEGRKEGVITSEGEQTGVNRPGRGGSGVMRSLAWGMVDHEGGGGWGSRW